jgi:hypothetical protein
VNVVGYVLVVFRRTRLTRKVRILR